MLRVFQGYHSQFRGKLFDRTILQPFYTTYMHIVEASRAVNIDFLSRGKGRKFTSTMLQIPRRGVNDYCLSRSRSSLDFRAKENRGLSPTSVTFRIDENFRGCNAKNGEESRLWSQREPVTLMNAKLLLFHSFFPQPRSLVPISLPPLLHKSYENALYFCETRLPFILSEVNRVSLSLSLSLFFGQKQEKRNAENSIAGERFPH